SVIPTSLSISNTLNFGIYYTQWYRIPVSTGGSDELVNTSGINTGSTSSSLSSGLNDNIGSARFYAITINPNAPSQCRSTTSSQSGLIEVYVRPTITNPAAPPGGYTTGGYNYCQNQSTGITTLTANVTNPISYGTLIYEWRTNTQRNITFTSGIAVAPNSNTLSYSTPTDSLGSLFYWFVARNGGPAGCDTAASTVTSLIRVTVNPIPIVTSSNLNTGGNYCQGDIINQYNVLASPGTGGGSISYQWFVSKIQNQIGDSLNLETSNLYTPSSDSLNTNYYAIRIRNASCSTFLYGPAVTVNTRPNITLNPATTTGAYCFRLGILNNITNLTVGGTASNGSNNVRYEWFRTTINSNASGVTTGNTTSSYTPVDTIAGNSYYFAVISNNLGLNQCKATTTVSGVIRIYTKPEITNYNAAAAQYCRAIGGVASSAFTVNTNLGLLGQRRITWYRNTTGLNNSGDSVGVGSTNNPSQFNVPLDFAGRYYYFAVVRNLDAPSACDTALSDTSRAIQIFNNPIITTQPDSQTNYIYCQNQTMGLTPFSVVANNNGVGILRYQWYINNNKSNVGGSAVNNSNSASQAPTTSQSYYSPQYYYVVVSNGARNFGLLACDSVVSNYSASVTLNRVPIIDYATSSLNNAQYCNKQSRTSLTLVLTSTLANLRYNWFISNVAGSLGDSIPLSNSQNFTPFDTIGVYYYTVFVTNGTCGTTSNVQTAITVYGNPSITAQPSKTPQSLCQGTIASQLSVSALNALGGTGNLNYQWYFNSQPNINNLTAIAGATSSSIIPRDTVSRLYYFVRVSNNNIGGNNCELYSDSSGSISYFNAPTIDYNLTNLTNRSGCLRAGTVTPFIIVANNNGNGVLSYQWYRNTINQTSGATPVGTNSNMFRPIDTMVSTSYYYAVVSNSTAPTGTCKNTTSNVIGQVDIYGTPILDTVRSLNYSYCENQTATASPLTVNVINLNSVNAQVFYQWYVNTTNSYVGAIPINGATSSTYVPPTTNFGTFYYFVAVRNAGPNACDSTFSPLGRPIVVSRSITISSQPNPNSNYCQNGVAATLSVTAVSNDGNTNLTYQWYRSSVQNTLGVLVLDSISRTFTPATSTVGTLYYSVVIGNSNCSINSNQATVNVLGLPSITTALPVVGQPVCFNLSQPVKINIIANDALGGRNLNYQWFRNLNQQNFGGVALTSIDSTTNVNDTVGTHYYYVVLTNALSGNSCKTTSLISGGFTSYIAPSITSQSLRITDTCYFVNSLGQSLGLNATPGLLGSLSYQWFVNKTGVNSGGNSLGINATQQPSLDSIGRNFYYVVLSNNAAPVACRQTTSNVLGQVTVYSSPTI
ncbi:MAG: hypothetical protein ORN85_07255, partial [Sediminibacterium sp.]|nr:hypothetical protein [Sediminibacterium sp.]